MMRYNNMIKWSEYRFSAVSVKKQNRVDKKLSKNNKAVVKKTEDKKDKRQWSKKKKIALGVILAGILATVAFVVMIFVFDLGPVRPIASSKEDARVVGRCEGFDVRYEELRYVTHVNRATLDKKYGEYSTLSADKKAEYESELRQTVSAELKNNYAILSLCEKHGVDVNSKEAKTYVNESIEGFVNEVGGKKEYKEWLKENKLTDAFMRLMYKVSYLEGALIEKLSEKGEEMKYSTSNLDDFVGYVMEEDDYVKVIHAYYPKSFAYSDGRGAKAHASDALAAILTAEDDEERFSLMKSAIGNAPFVAGYSVTGTDYYITAGQMHPDYEDVAFSLGEYEISEVLELDEGYYIIMRVPKVRDEVAPRAYELIEFYEYAVLKDLVDEHKDLITFEPDKYFASLTLAEIE